MSGGVASLDRPTQLLAQYLVRCPCCRSLAAAHVDEHAVDMQGPTRVLVRYVCAKACSVGVDLDEATVWSLLPEPATPAPVELVA